MVNGHHRHNAAKEAGEEFPVLPIDVGKDGRDRYAGLALSYHCRGGYDPDHNPYTPMDPKVPEWNADGIPTTHYLKETTEFQNYWSDFFKIKALRGPGALDGTLGDLLADPAYQLSTKQVDGMLVRVGRKTYDHAKSYDSTTFDHLTLSYTGDKDHPDSYQDLLENGELTYSSLGDERTMKLSEVRDTPLRQLLRGGDKAAPHELEIDIKVDTY